MRAQRSLMRRGGDEESRTPDPLLARQVLSQLSYTPTLFTLWLANSVCCDALVGLSGLEPPTSRLSGVRSNHLSYKPSGLFIRFFSEPSKMNSTVLIDL